MMEGHASTGDSPPARAAPTTMEGVGTQVMAAVDVGTWHREPAVYTLWVEWREVRGVEK